MKKWFISVVFILFICGCQANPQTGQAELKPDVVAAIDKAAEKTSEQLKIWGPAATAAYPPAAGIVGILGLLVGAWQKRKSNRAHGTTAALVSGIEEFKDANPTEWKKLKDRLHIGPEAENVIRAMRGLPEIM